MKTYITATALKKMAFAIFIKSIQCNTVITQANNLLYSPSGR